MAFQFLSPTALYFPPWGNIPKRERKPPKREIRLPTVQVFQPFQVEYL